MERRFVKVTSCGNGAAAQLLEWRLDGGGPVNHLAYRTSSPHYVEQYGFGGDPSSLVVWIGTDDDETIVLDPATGRVIDRFADEYRLLQTDDPNVAIAVLGDGSVVQFDVVRNLEVGPSCRLRVRDGERLACATAMSLLVDTTRMAVVGLQGVDFETASSWHRAIDSDGEFEIGWYDMTADTLYLVVNRAGQRADRASRHRHR